VRPAVSISPLTSVTILRAHSVAEVQLFLILTPCPACGMVAQRPRGGVVAPNANHDDFRLYAACARCLRDYPSVFVIDPPPRRGPGGGTMAINPTERPSEIIDLAGWITLYRHITERVWREMDKHTARRLAWEAGLCLDEALKFYLARENFPPESAFFSSRSLVTFRANRAQFDRRIVLHHRSQAPQLTDVETRMDGEHERSWWRFWQKHVEPRARL